MPKQVGKAQGCSLIVLITRKERRRSFELLTSTHLWPSPRPGWFLLAVSTYQMDLSFGLFLLWPPHLADFSYLNTSTCLWYPALRRTRISFGEYWCLSIFPHDLLWLFTVHFLLWENSPKDLMLLSWNLTRPGTEDMKKRSSIIKAVVSRRYFHYIEWINKKLLLCSTGTNYHRNNILR